MSQNLDTQGAAKRLGLSASTLNKLRLTGGGPRYAKMGARVLYPTAELDAWVASRIRESTSAR